MLGLCIELSLVAALFVWLNRRQLRDRNRDRASRIRPSQLHFDLDEES